MHWLFWILLLTGIVLVVWPFVAVMSAGMAIFLWILGAFFVIAAFFMLPSWWTPRTAPVRADGRRGTGPPPP